MLDFIHGPFEVGSIVDQSGLIPDREGCYVICNKENGRIYVGKGKNVGKRVADHFKGLNGNADVFKDYVIASHHNRLDQFCVYYLLLEDTDFNTLEQLESGLMLLTKALTIGYNNKLSCNLFRPMLASHVKSLSDDFQSVIDDKWCAVFFRDHPKCVEDGSVWDIIGFDTLPDKEQDEIQLGAQLFDHITAADISNIFSLSYFHKKCYRLVGDYHERTGQWPVYDFLSDLNQEVFDGNLHNFPTLECRYSIYFDCRELMFGNVSFDDAYASLLGEYKSLFLYVNNRLANDSSAVVFPGHLPQDIYASLLLMFYSKDMRLLLPCYITSFLESGYDQEGDSVFLRYDFDYEQFLSVISLWDSRKEKYSTGALRKLVASKIHRSSFSTDVLYKHYIETVMTLLFEAFDNRFDALKSMYSVWPDILDYAGSVEKICKYVFICERNAFDSVIVTEREKKRMRLPVIGYSVAKKYINDLGKFNRAAIRLRKSDIHHYRKMLSEEEVDAGLCSWCLDDELSWDNAIYDAHNPDELSGRTKYMVRFLDIKHSFVFDFFDKYIDRLSRYVVSEGDCLVDIPIVMLYDLINARRNALLSPDVRICTDFDYIRKVAFLWCSAHSSEWEYVAEPVVDVDDPCCHMVVSISSSLDKNDWHLSDEYTSYWFTPGVEKSIRHDNSVYGLRRVRHDRY